MAAIHPTASIEGDVQLADDVQVGPHCVLTGPITIDSGTALLGNVYVTGPATIGRSNAVYPFTCLGFAPQHAKFDTQTPGEGLVIGNDNTFRESVTVHRAFADDGPTRIGDRNMFMVGAHVGHDSLVGNDCTFVNGSMLGGHVTVQDSVIVGGNTCIHQFCRIGRGAMLSGCVGTTQDLGPYFMLTGINVCGAVNLIGARRSGMTREELGDIRWAFRVICRDGLPVDRMLEVLRERSARPLIDEYITFIESSDRGVLTARPKPLRGTSRSTEKQEH